LVCVNRAKEDRERQVPKTQFDYEENARVVPGNILARAICQWGRRKELKTGGECIPLSTLLMLIIARCMFQ
jgi:hypothetical protein